MINIKKKGGETMYHLAKLARYKVVVAIMAALLIGLVVAPIVSAGAAGPTTATYGMAEVESGLGGSLGKQDLRTTVAKIINVALSLLGVVAVVIILIGGFRWMTAGGNDEKVTEARKWIFSGIIGLAIILSAWAIARFVIQSLSDATTGGSLDLD